MKLRSFFVFAVPLLFISNIVFSQPGRISVSKEPAWVSGNNIDYSKTSLDKDAADGYINVSFETQISLADQSKYFRSSKKIISQAGVQNGSEISASFDPSYQQLIFHTIRIIRNGEILNRLKLSNIKTVHQEKELTNFIYNGTLDAVLIPDDVRKGDVIEYSYTIKGFNPIFKNKYTDEYNMEYAVPIYQLYYKLIVPQGRKINIKNLNLATQPSISPFNGQLVYEWHKNNIPSKQLQDYTPSWHNPYAQVLVSEYNSWKEVNDWAMGLFPIKKELSAAVQKKIREIQTEYTSDAERTKAALHFVQDDIRYMGIEMGENSHKPADPSKIFLQRFGDCKEKSYLLCCMLRAMHIDASPVLINTVYKSNTSGLLPAATDFDHVTVRVKLDNVYYWFDPTIAYQRGDIKNLFYPDYQAGLVISDSTTGLTQIAFRNISYVRVKEYFKVTTMSGGGRLTVSTSFFGDQADVVRDDYNNESTTEIMNRYQKFYAGYYEDIKADSLTYNDDDSTGIFKTIEYYSIPKFWTLDKANVNKFSFSDFMINNIMRRPKEKDRRMPFSLLFPAKYQEELTVDLPEDWKVTESETHLKNTSYVYNRKFYCVNNYVHLETDYENYKDHTTIDEAPAYFKDLGEYDDIANIEISSSLNETGNDQSHTYNKDILPAILFIGSVISVIIWRLQRNK